MCLFRAVVFEGCRGANGGHHVMYHVVQPCEMYRRDNLFGCTNPAMYWAVSVHGHNVVAAQTTHLSCLHCAGLRRMLIAPGPVDPNLLARFLAASPAVQRVWVERMFGPYLRHPAPAFDLANASLEDYLAVQEFLVQHGL